MIISPAIFALFCLVMIGARFFYTRALYFTLPVLLMVIPVARSELGPIPIYLYDVVLVGLLSLMVERWRDRPWPPQTPAWWAYFLTIFAIFGTFLPAFRYGMHPELIWNFLHTGLAYSAVLLGAGFVRTTRETERSAFCWGLAAGLSMSAVVALLQWSSASWSLYFLDLFYSNRDLGDYDRAQHVAELYSSRAAGAFGSPNTLGVIAVVGALSCWLFSRGKVGLVVFIATGAATLAVFATGSRQALIFPVLVALGYFAVTPLSAGSLRLVLAGAAIFGVATSLGASTWVERLGRLGAGTQEDNVYARLVIGPERLWDMYVYDPSWLFTGVGLEVQKLQRFGIEGVAEAVNGFVSNGYLLYAYYLGVVGFVVMLLFWVYVVRRSLSAAGPFRGKCIGIAVGMVFIIFADNHGVIAEELVISMMLLAGAVIALGYRPQERQATLRVSSGPRRTVAAPELRTEG